MKKTVRLFLIAIAAIGIGATIGFFFPQILKASSVIDDSSRESIAPSAYYDERWVATEVCINTANGVMCGTLQNIAGSDAGEIAYKDINGVTVPYVKFSPQARVVKWRVYGHIHFP